MLTQKAIQHMFWQPTFMFVQKRNDAFQIHIKKFETFDVTILIVFKGVIIYGVQKQSIALFSKPKKEIRSLISRKAPKSEEKNFFEPSMQGVPSSGFFGWYCKTQSSKGETSIVTALSAG